jgi:hypothetical protein
MIVTLILIEQGRQIEQERPRHRPRQAARYL